MEEWKDVVDYEGVYKISNYGVVISLDRYVLNNGTPVIVKGRQIAPIHKKEGYLQYALSKSGRRKKYYAHRLVAQAFIPNPDNLPEVNHKDGNKANNHVSNLEWVSKADNQKHAHTNNLLSRDEHGRFKSVA